MIAGLWFLSKVGSCCNFLTLFYIGNNVSLSIIAILFHWCALPFLVKLLCYDSSGQCLYCCIRCLCSTRNMKTRLTLSGRRQLLKSRSNMQSLMRRCWARSWRGHWRTRRWPRLFVMSVSAFPNGNSSPYRVAFVLIFSFSALLDSEVDVGWDVVAQNVSRDCCDRIDLIMSFTSLSNYISLFWNFQVACCNVLLWFMLLDGLLLKCQGNDLAKKLVHRDFIFYYLLEKQEDISSAINLTDLNCFRWDFLLM